MAEDPREDPDFALKMIGVTLGLGPNFGCNEEMRREVFERSNRLWESAIHLFHLLEQIAELDEEMSDEDYRAEIEALAKERHGVAEWRGSDLVFTGIPQEWVEEAYGER